MDIELDLGDMCSAVIIAYILLSLSSRVCHTANIEKIFSVLIIIIGKH